MITALLTKLPFLKRVPIIGGALKFMVKKSRLAIEYGMIAVIITIGGYTFTLWNAHKRTQLDLAQTQTEVVSLNGKVGVLETITQAQATRIDDLKALREKDSETLEDLLNDYKQLAAHDAQARVRLQKLEKNSPVIKHYLDSSIPDDLICLLNKECAPKSDNGNQSGGEDRKRDPSKELIKPMRPSTKKNIPGDA